MDWQVSMCARRCCLQLGEDEPGSHPHRSGTKLSIRKTRQRSRTGTEPGLRGGCWCGRHPQGAHPLACPALLSKAHQAVCSAAQEAQPHHRRRSAPAGDKGNVQQQLPTDRNSHPGHPCAHQQVTEEPQTRETAAGESLQGKTVLEGWTPR